MEPDHPAQSFNRFRQGGAVMVEFAVTVSLFLVIVIAIIEFVVLIMNFSQANEATRSMARIAVVNTPVHDIAEVRQYCEDGEGANRISDTLDNAWTEDDGTATRMFRRAEAHIPNVRENQILVSYECDEGPARSIMVSVSLTDLTYELLIPGYIGLETPLPYPAFTTHRTAESLQTILRGTEEP